MELLKRKFYAVFLVIMLATISSCAMFGNDTGTSYENGYYSTTMKHSYNEVYDATIEAIKTGETYDSSGSTYDIKLNKKTDEAAVIEAFSNRDRSDYLEVVIKPESDKLTRLSIKYGSQGNSIRSSALEDIIDGNIKYGNL
ncbi:hypothetical protein LO80_08710 [Candidatus Francisella endociliophora]|uniref:DUF3568 domain-containing protein n=1 Tax=Candidatus Francisella endociliophora TaxID=653937 RepID=A0A097ER64_9GAMM|nr:DUF3568 family protein [Francisella sp. FSC1006]AIT10044.1 hypothetical protein LO80_08710 [Francisella sp. FSC1006]